MWKREEKWGAATLDNRWVDVSDNRVSHPLRTSGGFHCRTDKIKLPRVKRASESPVQICIQELDHYKMRSCTQVAFPPETYCEDLWRNSAGPSREAKFCYFTTWRMPYLPGNQWWLKNTGIKPSMSEIGYHRTHHQPAPGHQGPGPSNGSRLTRLGTFVVWSAHVSSFPVSRCFQHTDLAELVNSC